jgi:hypothetical protein
MGTSGAAIYNPATGLPSIVDANELAYVTTSVGGATTTGTSTIPVASAAGLAVDQFVQVDANGTNAEILQITAIVTNTLTVWPPTAHNHAFGVPVVCKVARQVTTIGDPVNPAFQAGVDALGNLKVNIIAGGMSSVKLSASVTRPANTTAYVPGTLVANSTTAGSVVPLAFPNAVTLAGYALQVTRARLVTTSTSIAAASFSIHLFESSPTVSVGDGAAFDAAGVLSLSGIATYAGFIPIDVLQAGSDGAVGFGTPGTPQGIMLGPAVTTVYALIECTTAYTPTSAETITVILEGTNS